MLRGAFELAPMALHGFRLTPASGDGQHFQDGQNEQEGQDLQDGQDAQDCGEPNYPATVRLLNDGNCCGNGTMGILCILCILSILKSCQILAGGTLLGATNKIALNSCLQWLLVSADSVAVSAPRISRAAAIVTARPPGPPWRLTVSASSRTATRSPRRTPPHPATGRGRTSPVRSQSAYRWSGRQ